MPGFGRNRSVRMSNEMQTHEDIPEIPEGVEVPDSSGSLIPDVEEPEPIDYSDVKEA